MVYPEGFEPPTLDVEERCSIQLSYGQMKYYMRFVSVCQVVLLDRIELSLPPYQRGVLPFNYKSIGTLPLIRTEILLPFERSDFTNLSSRALVPAEGIEPSQER